MIAYMNSELKILGVTPARGGSKGIPRKNIKNICGKPLIAWTIESALSSHLITKYVVSTEDEEIAKIASYYGAEVHHRPAELATDEATTLEVLQNILKTENVDIVVLLQCTSPVRTKGLIDRCIEQFIASNADSLATGFMCNLFEWGTYSARRQDLQEYFHDDGNVYVLKPDLIREGELWGNKRQRFLTEREENFEIDDYFDFWLNEKILEKRESGKR